MLTSKSENSKSIRFSVIPAIVGFLTKPETPIEPLWRQERRSPVNV